MILLYPAPFCNKIVFKPSYNLHLLYGEVFELDKDLVILLTIDFVDFLLGRNSFPQANLLLSPKKKSNGSLGEARKRRYDELKIYGKKISCSPYFFNVSTSEKIISHTAST